MYSVHIYNILLCFIQTIDYPHRSLVHNVILTTVDICYVANLMCISNHITAGVYH
jgi:hypothetical protein